jgi:hypothetical protein
MLYFISISSMNVTAQVVEYSVRTREFKESKNTLPFDEPFVFKVTDAPENSKYTLSILMLEQGKAPREVFPETIKVAINGEAKFVVTSFLKPNRHYKIELKEVRALNSNEKNKLKEILVDNEFKNSISGFILNTTRDSMLIRRYLPIFYTTLKENGIENIGLIESKITSGEAQHILTIISGKLISFSQNFVIRSKQINIDSNLKFPYRNFFDTVFDQSSNYQYPKNRFGNVKSFEDELKSSLNDWKVSDSLNIKNRESLNNEQKDSLFKIIKGNYESLQSTIKSLNEINALLDDYIDNTLPKELLENSTVINEIGSSIVDQNTNAGPYTSQSFGYGYSPAIDDGFLYLSFGIFLRPVNNRVPLSHIPKKERWKAMTSLNLGLTLENISTNKPMKVYGLGSIFGNKAGLLGIGFRPYHFIKFDINGLLYKVDNPNPLIQNKRYAVAPMFGISLNLNLIKLLAGQPNSLTTLQTAINN